MCVLKSEKNVGNGEIVEIITNINNLKMLIVLKEAEMPQSLSEDGKNHKPKSVIRPTTG